MATRDALLQMANSAARFATTQHTALDLINGTPTTKNPMFAEIFYSAATNATGANAVTFTIEHSDDNATFFPHTSGAADVINLSPTAQSGIIYLPVVTDKRYVRLVATFTGGGTTPAITYSAYLGLGKP